jgi:hypothetical protein
VGWQDDLYVVTLEFASKVFPETIYDLLADLRSHLEWGGSRQPSRFQHLVSIHCPDGPAAAGTEFHSIGQTRDGQWIDRSRVIRAVRPRLFEFVTEGHLMHAHANDDLRGRWIHRYLLIPSEGGCRLRYRVSQRLMHPTAKEVRLPEFVYRVMIPTFVGSGIQNLLQMAEDEVAEVPVILPAVEAETGIPSAG